MKIRIAFFIVLIITAILGFNYLYQDHRDIEKEATHYQIQTSEIALQFLDNLKHAETKYRNTTIEITRKISEKDTSSITLDDVVFCQFTSIINKDVALNATLKIKDRVIGYDDLLQQVKLDQCIIN